MRKKRTRARRGGDKKRKNVVRNGRKRNSQRYKKRSKIKTEKKRR